MLGGDDFRAFLADIDALDAASDPGEFWANWIGFVCERTPL